MAQARDQFVQAGPFPVDRLILAIIVILIFILIVIALRAWWLSYVVSRGVARIGQEIVDREAASKWKLAQRLEPYTSVVSPPSSRRTPEILWVGTNSGPWVEELTQSGKLRQEQERGVARRRRCTTLELVLVIILLFELVSLLRFPRTWPWWWMWKAPKYPGLKLTAIGDLWRRLFR